MSYTQLLYHLVIRTKSSQKVLPLTKSEELYRYLWGIIKNKKSKLFRINGMEDHIHLLIAMHPSYALADFVRDMKAESSKMLKRTSGFENFTSWSEGYAAITCNNLEKDIVIKYITEQRSHHQKVSFKEEYLAFLKEMGLALDERDWNK